MYLVTTFMMVVFYPGIPCVFVVRTHHTGAAFQIAIVSYSHEVPNTRARFSIILYSTSSMIHRYIVLEPVNRNINYQVDPVDRNLLDFNFCNLIGVMSTRQVGVAEVRTKQRNQLPLHTPYDLKQHLQRPSKSWITFLHFVFNA